MSKDTMNYVWRDYDPQTMRYIETWLNESAVQSTGLDEGFRSFYEYWAREDGFLAGENYWCKVAFENGTPLAVIAVCLHEQTVLVMEIVVEPNSRNRGIGAKLLRELLTRKEILGFAIEKSEAVIFPSNIASRKAFENAGYRHHHTHEDGTAMYYVYDSGFSKECSCSGGIEPGQ